MLMNRFIQAFTVGLGALATVSSALAASYTFVPLDGPVGSATAYAVNSSGVVTGSAFDPVGYAERATTWTATQPTFLERRNSAGSRGLAINDRGQVAGYAWDSSTGQTAAVWSKGTQTLLAKEQGTTSQFATGINNASLVVGNRSFDYGQTTQAVTWLNYDITPLQMLGANASYASAVNGAGQIAGYLMYGDPYSARNQAVVWQGDLATPLLSKSGSNCCSRAHGINDSGVIVGETFVGGALVSVYWDGSDRAIELPTIGEGARARGVNNVGQAVGQAVGVESALFGEVAMLWDLKTGSYVNLNTFLSAEDVAAGWSLLQAYDINDAGDIVGHAFNRKSGNFRPFALMAAVPEPSAWLMSLLGLAALLAARRTKVSRVV